MPAPIPVATLDTRYSSRDAVPVPWDEARRLLETAELSWIASVRPDGRPHVTPLVAVWVDGLLAFHTDEQEVKYANLTGNPNVVVTTGCNHWDGGVDVVVEGPAVRVTDEETLERLAVAFARRWDGRWRLVVRDGEFRNLNSAGWPSRVFAVRPTRAYAHTKGDPFAVTRYRFEQATTTPA
jgi:nitroimidazol reductase NimA-like FMN-containing flavoprotein (pyridoxamine 5'-phosphate oxidase superfamily)